MTGIKEWDPAEKAEYIAKMIDGGMTYQTVMRKIGSNTPTVRKNYIAYRLLLQIENHTEGISMEDVEARFSVMYLSLRTRGVQSFLSIDVEADVEAARHPVPAGHFECLQPFALWMFGEEEGRDTIFPDSRRTDDFGKILESTEAINYLIRNENPRFEVAFRIAGGDEEAIVKLIDEAADNIELALGRTHAHRDSEALKDGVRRLAEDADGLLRDFPDIRDDIWGSAN